MGACWRKQRDPAASLHWVQAYERGDDVHTVPAFTLTSSSSEAYRQAVRSLCLHAGPSLRPEYIIHFARRGTLHATEYEALGFSSDGLGAVPAMLAHISKAERSDVLCDYGRALHAGGTCSLHEVANAIMRHYGASLANQECVHAVVNAVRDALHATLDPETTLLSGMTAAMRVGDLELASLFLAHVECVDANDSRRRRLLTHVLTTHVARTQVKF